MRPQKRYKLNRCLLCWVPVSIGLLLLCATLLPTTANADDIMVGQFLPGSLSQWSTKSFKGDTNYQLAGDGATRTLVASCDSSASALARRIKVDLTKTPILRWQWRVDHTYDGLDDTTKAGDDYAARLYVIDDGGIAIWRTRAINYVWANSQPLGQHWPNAFTDKAMMVAVASGQPAQPQQWVSEARNVRDDFKQFYQRDLEQIDAIALMTDCDNSGRKGRAYYRNIHFTADSPN